MDDFKRSRPSSSHSGSLYVPGTTSSSRESPMNPKRQQNRDSRTSIQVQKRDTVREQVTAPISTVGEKRERTPMILERPAPAFLQDPASTLMQNKTLRGPVQLLDDRLKSLQKSNFSLLEREQQACVVGVLGKESVGKSLILSSLAGIQDMHKEKKESILGIDFYTTPERLILLDSQPMCSTITLEKLKSQGNIPESFRKRPHLWNDILSKQITKFLLHSCHVLLVVLDTCKDDSFFKFIKAVQEIVLDCKLSAKVIFITNKAQREDYSPSRYTGYCSKIEQILGSSGLDFHGPAHLNTFYPKLYDPLEKPVNLFYLSLKPAYDLKETQLENIPDYLTSTPLGDWNTSLIQLKTLIYQAYVPRQTEVAWFQSAQQTWESIKQLDLEYFMG